MKRFSAAFLIARFWAITSIPVLFAVALLLATSNHPVLEMLALGALGPLLVIELVSSAILGVKLIVSPAARAKFKGELQYPGVRAGAAAQDRAVVRWRDLAFAAGAFTATLLAWLVGLAVPAPVWETCAPIAALGLILFWATANTWFIVLVRAASLRDERLTEMVGGRWSDDGRTLIPDYGSVGAYQ